MGFGWPSIGFGVEGVNSRVTRFLIAVLRENTMMRSWTFMDFYDQPAGSSIVPLLIECNFRGRPRDAHRAIVTDPTGRLDRRYILHLLSRPTMLMSSVATDTMTDSRHKKFRC